MVCPPCRGGSHAESGDATPLAEGAAPDAPAKQYEMGWDDALFMAYRKEILSRKRRGPVEFCQEPQFDPAADLDAPIICKFPDGCTFTVAHVTMVP